MSEFINLDDLIFGKNKKDDKIDFGIFGGWTRMAITGSSGAGKTQTLLQLLMSPNFGQPDLERVVVYSGFPEEPAYQWFRDKYCIPNGIDFMITDDIDKIPPIGGKKKQGRDDRRNPMPEPNYWTADTPSIMIFDDFIGETGKKKKEIESKITTFARQSRKQGLHLAVISQYFYDIPVNARANMNLFIFTHMNAKTFNMVSSSIAEEIPPEELRKMYRKCRQGSEASKIFSIWTDFPLQKKYRCGVLTPFVVPE